MDKKNTSLEQAVKKMVIASGNKTFKVIKAKDARALWLEINRRELKKKRDGNAESNN